MFFSSKPRPPRNLDPFWDPFFDVFSQASPRSQTLFSLAEQLQEVSSHDTESIIKLLEELENIPATVDLLRPGDVGCVFLLA